MKGQGKEFISLLEAISDLERWIWHEIFGPSDTVDDIKVLDQFPIINRVMLMSSLYSSPNTVRGTDRTLTF